MFKNKKGFTLIELLIVIAIIAIIAAVIIVALNPAKRLKDSRDAVRANAVSEMLTAIKLDQVDNGGTYHANISGLAAATNYMIVNGANMVAGCDDNNANCDVDPTADGSCVNMAFLVSEGYLGEMPVSPAGAVTWDDGSAVGNEGTGYVLSYNSTTGSVTVSSCESEGIDTIITLTR